MKCQVARREWRRTSLTWSRTVRIGLGVSVVLTYVPYSVDDTDSPGRNVFGCEVIFMSESVPGASMIFHAFSVWLWQGSLASFTNGLLQFCINLRYLLSIGRRAPGLF
jgi:hypothetical protein